INGDPKSPVQLNCNSCHQLDAGRVGPNDPDRPRFERLEKAILGLPRESLLPARAEGAYYLPVNFEMHCKSCHPLHTPSAVSDGKAVAELPVPHREQPDALRKILQGQYAARLTKDKNPDLFVPTGPGGRLDAHQHPGVIAFGTEVERLADAALKALLLNLAPPTAAGSHPPSGGFACGKCHYSTGSGKTEVAALPDKSIWFVHAKFNHVSHRGLKCADCHPGTEGSFAPGGAVNEREPARLVGIKTCQACHAAAGTAVNLGNGMIADAAGIRHSCSDCHRYHNGDHPLQGMGAPKRDPADPLNLGDWMKGGPTR
ncbi:MAG TPA: cytochrome c3 family protein, partial [Urbifossiella sp.]